MGKACEEFRELLVAEAADRLSLEDQARMREHLAACLGCAELAESQRMVWKALDTWETPPISPDFNSRLIGRIECANLGFWERWAGRWRPFIVHRGLPVAAAVALTATLLVVGYHPARQPSPAPNPVIENASIGQEQSEGVLEDLETLRDLNGIAPAGAADPAM